MQPLYWTLVLGLFLCAVGTATAQECPKYEDAHLQRGRVVWMNTCQVCHASDLVGAPRIDKPEAWAPRIKKGKAVLYEHALKGFFGPMGTEMPPRGGNPKLSDEEVKAAVDYMVKAATPK